MEVFEARAMYNERLRDAALERQARQVQKYQPQSNPHQFSHLKARIGDTLISLGQRLKREKDLVYG
ncbi:MAG: hypothetical protein WBO46_16325 [Caldilineaceae bacterium]